MIRVLTLMLETYLRDKDHGLAAVLPGVSRLATDPDPLAKGVIHVVSGYSNTEVAMNDWPKKLPAVVVEFTSPPMRGAPNLGPHAYRCTLNVSYVDETKDLLKAIAAGDIVCRAIRQTLYGWAAQPQDSRTLLGIRMLRVVSVEEAQFPDDRSGSATVAGGLVAVVEALDLNPTPA